MDTTTLRTFITLAEIKNFTKTAQQLFVAQSTVTNRIRDLETELGVALFIRNHKQVDLTPAGLKFLEYAQRFIELETTALQEVQTSPTYAKKINIGTTNTIYECHLQKKIRAYLHTNPDISLGVTISHTLDMLQKSVFSGQMSIIEYYREAEIISMVQQLGLTPLKNPCPYDGHTKRQEAKELIAALQKFNAEAYDHLAAAMRTAPQELWPAKCTKQELADKFHTFWQQKRSRRQE